MSFTAMFTIIIIVIGYAIIFNMVGYYINVLDKRINNLEDEIRKFCLNKDNENMEEGDN